MQKTFRVKSRKIKIVSRLCKGLCVRTNINREKFFSNFEIMKDKSVSKLGEEKFSKLFIKRAMDRAYLKWVKKEV